MDRFQAMQVFTRVVDVNSFSAAADNLGLPRATVTTTIQNLEKRLKVRLLNRTTRRISLTPDGAAYYERCVRILDELEDTEASFIDAERGPRGRLRIDVPPVIGRKMLIPNLCGFHQRYPDLEIVIGMTDRPVDMVREAVDCVIRIGELRDSSLVARRIGTFRSVVCAAPSYIERHGIPTSIEDLVENHRAVHYFSSRTGRNIDWDFLVDGQSVDIKMRGVVSVNDGDAYVACGVQGFGVIQPARFMVFHELQRGDLVEVLPQLQSAPMPISVLYQHSRHLSPKVRVFADWVADLFATCPLSSGCQLGSETSIASLKTPSGSNTLRSLAEAHNFAESLIQASEILGSHSSAGSL